MKDIKDFLNENLRQHVANMTLPKSIINDLLDEEYIEEVDFDTLKKELSNWNKDDREPISDSELKDLFKDIDTAKKIYMGEGLDVSDPIVQEYITDDKDIFFDYDMNVKYDSKEYPREENEDDAYYSFYRWTFKNCIVIYCHPLEDEDTLTFIVMKK
jgi:hypothetical protein